MVPNSVLRGAIAERAEELFFFLFSVSLKSQRLLIFKLLMNAAFLVALVESIRRYSFASWIATFLCLYVVNAVHLCTELSDILFLMNSSDVKSRLMKPLATSLDIVGSILLKFTVLVWIIEVGIPSHATLHLVPTWVCMLCSSICRCFVVQNRLPVELITRHRVANLFGALVYTVYRFLQPLLIILKIDRHLKTSWFISFAPSFALAFLALGFSILLYSFVPWVHYHSSRQLRETARYLTRLIAFGMFLAGAGSIVFLLNLCQLLESVNAHHGHSVTAVRLYRVVTPLLFIFIVFLGVAVAYYNLYKDYQQQLASRVLTRLDRPGSRSAHYSALPASDSSPEGGNGKWNMLKYEKVTHWLVKSSANVFMQVTSDSIPNLEECALKFGYSKVGNRKAIIGGEVPSCEGIGDIEMCVFPSLSNEENEEPPVHKRSSTSEDTQPLTMLLESSGTSSASPTLTSVDRCAVCFSRAVSVILKECGHAATCLSCAASIAKMSNHAPQCPICRQTYSSMFDMPLGNRFNYQQIAFALPIAKNALRESAENSPAEAVPVHYEVIRSDWLYSFIKPHVSQSAGSANGDGRHGIVAAADMNNALAIGNTVNTLAAINTVSHHFSLIDILL